MARPVSVLLLALAVAVGVRGLLTAQEPQPVRPVMPPRDSGPAVQRRAVTGAIAGVVTNAGTGAPLRRVNVVVQRVSGSGAMPVDYVPGGQRSVVTDDRCLTASV